MWDSLEQFLFDLKTKWMIEDLSDHIDELAEQIERECYNGREEEKDK